MLTRRRFLAAGAALALPWRIERAVAESAAAGAMQLDAGTGQIRLRADGPETPRLLYAGTEPMTILRARPGQPLNVALHNSLAETTALQWDGLRGTSPSTPVVAPGGTAALAVTPPDPGTYWFHPALDTADQTARGLAGVLIVDDPVPLAVDGDLPLFFADWLVDPQNRIAGPLQAAEPPLATVFTVNNRPAPTEQSVAPGARLRLRLINGSTRRVMLVACEGAQPKVVAIDGQPSDLFEPIRDTIPIGPGARFDYVLDCPRVEGQAVRLILRGTERVAGTMEPDVVLVTLTTHGTVLPEKPPITGLPPNTALPRQIPLEKSKRAELVFDQSAQNGAPRWTVNGAALPSNPVLRVKRGDAVTLGFINASKELIPLRVQGQAIRLLHTKDDGWEPYWRDSVLLPPGSRNHAAFVADAPGRWTIESAFAAQWIGGLRCWFEVV